MKYRIKTIKELDETTIHKFSEGWDLGSIYFPYDAAIFCNTPVTKKELEQIEGGHMFFRRMPDGQSVWFNKSLIVKVEEVVMDNKLLLLSL